MSDLLAEMREGFIRAGFRVVHEEPGAVGLARKAPVCQIGPPAEPLPEVEELSAADGAELLDRQARRHLGLSGQEFARRYQAGEFTHDPRSAVARVAMLLPFVRI